ncbi:MAG: 30S ribosomal protein S14 [Pseudomonadota bacterium]|nr:30S ribosomal protein S14 [Pseudomonadota bacterium]
MAKKSSIENNLKRRRTVASKLASRATLSAIATRVRNRCELTGRARGYYRKFQVSRIALRELGNQGLIPGITKASW